MMRYALSPEGRDTIAIAQREIDEGKGIVADDDYFAALKDRRAKALDAR